MTRLQGARPSRAPTRSDPIDALEALANRERWSYFFTPSSTADERSLTIVLSGRYAEMSFAYEWDEEIGLLLVSCRIGPRISWVRKKEVRLLLDRVEKIRTKMKRSGWFDMAADEFIWFWEHLSLGGSGYKTWEEVIAASLGDALDDCNALTPLFLQTAWGNGNFNSKVIRLALKEVKGTA